MIHNCLWIAITSHSIYKNSSDLKSVTIMIVLEQLQFRVSIYALCDYFATLFRISEQLPAASVTRSFAHAKTVWDKSSKEKFSSYALRFRLRYLFLTFSRHMHVTCVNYRRKNQRSCARYPGAKRRIQLKFLLDTPLFSHCYHYD